MGDEKTPDNLDTLEGAQDAGGQELMTYSYHDEQEISAIRSMTTEELSKENNRHLTGGMIYVTGEDEKAKHDEAYDIIRDELVARQVLADLEDRRLIDGRELVQEE